MTVGIFKLQDDHFLAKNIYFNEIIIASTMYSFICFTDFVPNVKTQEIMGIAACSTVCIHLIANIFFMVKSAAHQAILKLKRRIAIKNSKQKSAQKIGNLSQETL